MDDSKSKNQNEVPENIGAQQAAEEVPAAVTDGSGAVAAAAEMIGEAERTASLEEIMDREFLSAEGDNAPEGADGTGKGNDADRASGTGAKDSGQATGNAPAEVSGQPDQQRCPDGHDRAEPGL